MFQGDLFERWLPVPNYEGLYEVSDFGRVRSLGRAGRGRSAAGRILVGHQREGYQRVRLCRDGQWKFVSVHGLVMGAFVGPLPLGKEIDHKDTNTLNNALWNLAYLTPSQNTSEAVRRRGAWSRKQRHKFTPEEVREVRRLALEGMSQIAIAKHFGCCRRAVGHILTGRNWKHV